MENEIKGDYKFLKRVILPVLIIILGFILRLSGAAESLNLSGDSARDIEIITDLATGRILPFTGPPTSLGWFRLGPASYYIFAPVLVLGQFQPVSITVFNIILDCLGIYFIYLLGRSSFNNKTGLIAGFLYASSVYNISYSRIPMHIGLTAPFSALFYLLLARFIRKRENPTFYLLFAVTGLLIQFNLTNILLLPVLIIAVLPKTTLRKLIAGFMIILLLHLPVICWDIRHHLSMYTKIVIWIPYRILSLAGIYTKKNIITGEKLINAFTIFSKALSQMIVPAGILLSFLTFTAASIYGLANRRRSGYGMVLSSLAVIIPGFFLHLEPNSHYFLVITPLVFLLLGTFVKRYNFLIPLIWIIFTVNINGIIPK